jgi:protein SCO1/2
VVALVATLTVGRAILARPAPTPPPLSVPLPAWALQNERGERFGSADLAGKVYVADFVFTSCPTVCPKLTQRMRELDRRTRRLGDRFHLITFTIDPENDTPERLAAYALLHQADPARWTFVTGPLDRIESTVVKGFGIAMGKEASGGIMSIFHGEHLVLVDQKGTIRGYYEADDEGVAKLAAHAELLLANP